MPRLALGLAALLAGCAQTIPDDAVSVCTPLCRCGDSPLPGEQRDCVASCTAQFEMHPLGAACVECVVGHATACAQLADDCNTACLQALPAGGPR